MRLKWSETLPDAYKAMMEMQKVVDNSHIEHKLLELIKVRASQINGCAYCLDMHTKDALAIGESQQRLNVVAAWREVPFYSEREKAALEWCESITNISFTGAPDKFYNNIKKLFSDEEIVELTMAIVVINCWNRLAVGFRSPVGDYVSDKSI